MDISKLQPDTWSHIQSIVSKDRVGNAYLIHGPSGSGKEAFACLLYTSPSPRDGLLSRMPSSA